MAFIPNTVLGSLVDRQNKIKRQIGNVLVNSEYDNNIEKSMDDSIGMKKHGYHNQLEKGGEGSRGGKIIGHTKSGKPIYDTFSHSAHKDFTHQDHYDAQNLHKKNIIKKHGKDAFTEQYKYANEDKEYDTAHKHFNRGYKMEQNAEKEKRESMPKATFSAKPDVKDDHYDDSQLKEQSTRHSSDYNQLSPHQQEKYDKHVERGANNVKTDKDVEDLHYSALDKVKNLKKSIEVYTLDSINRFRDDLSKAFDNEEISEADFEKGMRDVNGLQKKIITNKLGHQQTVFVRVNKDESEHHFNHGDKVKFEHGGKQKTGVIKKLKDHPVTDKFGTAHIEDEQGNKYSKSLRAIEHHQDSDANQTHTPVATAATISEVEEDQGVKRYSESDQDKPKSREEEHAHHAALKSELKRVNPKLHASNWENHDLSTADASAMQVINKQLKHQIRQSGGNTDVQPEKKETKLVTQQSILDNKRGVGGLKDLADYSKQEQSLGKKAYDGVKHSISGTKTTERMESTSERPDMKKNTKK